MSQTIDRSLTPGIERSGGGVETIRPHVGALVVLMLSVVVLTTGWFSADEVVMRQQSDSLLAGTWTAEPNLEASLLDPENLFSLLARSDRIDGDVAPYTKHPIAPVLFAAGEGVAGDRGLYFAGLFSLLGTAILFAHRFRWSPIAFWVPVLATTSLFHLSVVWAHVPALVIATVASLAAFGRDEPISNRRAFLAAVAVVGVSLLRSEGLLLGAALSVGLLATRPHDVGSRIRSALPLAGSVVAYLAEPAVREVWFGASAGPLTAPVASSAAESFVAGRLGVLRVMFIEPSIEAGLGQARFVGLLLLVGGSIALRRGRLRPTSAPVIFGAAAVMYAVGTLGSPIPGLFVAMPIMAAAVPWMSVRSAATRGAATAAVAFAGAVVLTSYDNAGGGDWGARYLFIGVPLLVLLVVPAIERARRVENTTPFIVAALICGLSVQVGILEGILSRGSTVETVDSVRQTIERELSDDPALVVAVSDERLSRFLYDRGLRGPSFHVPTASEGQFDQLIRPERVLWVDLGELAETRAGQIVATAGSVVIRTEVRR